MVNNNKKMSMKQNDKNEKDMKKWKELRNKIVAHNNFITSRIEKNIFVNKYGVERPFYHGGKYDGTALRKIWDNEKLIFHDVPQYIINNVPMDDRCPDEEIFHMCNLFGRGIIFLDTILRKIRHPNGLWKETDY